MGSRGHGDLAGLVLGSTAHKLIHLPKSASAGSSLSDAWCHRDDDKCGNQAPAIPPAVSGYERM
jgi:hypothetical protein